MKLTVLHNPENAAPAMLYSRYEVLENKFITTPDGIKKKLMFDLLECDGDDFEIVTNETWELVVVYKDKQGSLCTKVMPVTDHLEERMVGSFYEHLEVGV